MYALLLCSAWDHPYFTLDVVKKFLAADRTEKTAVKHLTVDSIWTNGPTVPTWLFSA